MLIEGHLWRHQALSTESMLRILLFFSQSLEKHVQNLIYAQCQCGDMNVTRTIIQVIPATAAGETTLQMNLERELGHPNIPKPVPKDWKLICPTNDCLLKCTVSTWWTHVCIFNALSAKRTVKPLVPKAKAKIHSPRPLPDLQSHKLHHYGKIKLDIEAKVLFRKND